MDFSIFFLVITFFFWKIGGVSVAVRDQNAKTLGGEDASSQNMPGGKKIVSSLTDKVFESSFRNVDFGKGGDAFWSGCLCHEKNGNKEGTVLFACAFRSCYM
jgi:hypothetical protein